MKKTLKSYTLLFLFGLALIVPVIQGCAAPRMQADPAPLEEEEEERR